MICNTIFFKQSSSTAEVLQIHTWLLTSVTNTLLEGLKKTMTQFFFPLSNPTIPYCRNTSWYMVISPSSKNTHVYLSGRSIYQYCSTAHTHWTAVNTHTHLFVNSLPMWEIGSRKCFFWRYLNLTLNLTPFLFLDFIHICVDVSLVYKSLESQ